MVCTTAANGFLTMKPKNNTFRRCVRGVPQNLLEGIAEAFHELNQQERLDQKFIYRKTGAQIKINYNRQGRIRFDKPERRNAIATAIVPGHFLSGNIYLNYNMDLTDFDLKKVIIHEVLHTLNFGHYGDSPCYMHSSYSSREQDFCEKTISSYKFLYNKFNRGIYDFFTQNEERVDEIPSYILEAVKQYLGVNGSTQDLIDFIKL